MANYDIRTLQLYLLENLKTLHSVFEKHNLRYYLVSGTMLGAVRHKGFIPWDDDIDLGMPRADYERFIEHSKEWLPEYLEFVCPEYDSDYPLPYGKVQDARTTVIEKTYRKLDGGVFIDIFPLDGVPESPIKRKWHFTRYLFWYKMLYLLSRDPYKHGRGINSVVPLLLQKTISKKFVHKQMRKILMESDYEESKYISEHYNRQRRYMRNSVFGTMTPIEFEDVILSGVEQPNEYLTIEYGDYMQLPPENKRKTHSFHYLNLELPYRDYKPE